MAFPTTLISLLTAAISALAFYHSQASIPKLTKYEEKAKKAADWSKAAEERLWNTRYTVGAGFVATTVSLLSSLNLVFFAPGGWAPSHAIWAAGMAASQRYASRYMTSFWGEQGKIPMLDDYNEAISDNKNVIDLLDVLAVGWATIAMLRVLGL